MVISFALGTMGVTGLVLWAGLSDIARAFAAGGWHIGWVIPAYIVPALCAALSWRWLFRPTSMPRFALLLRGTWIGLAVNWLLPVAQVGGEVVRARLLILRRFPAAMATATVTVDQILQLATQFVYAVIGLVLLVVLAGNSGSTTTNDVIGYGVGAVIALGVLSLVPYHMTRRNLFYRLGGLARRILNDPRIAAVAARAPDVDAEIRATYDRRGRLIVSALWRMGFRLALAGELWLALALLGHPVGFAEAVVMESLGQAVRAAAFVIPAGLGVQEGAFMALAATLGLPAETGLVLSLVRRVRELLVGVPGVIAWHVEEIAVLRSTRHGAAGRSPV